MCCNDWNKLSFNERVQCYISKKEEIEAEYKSRMETLNKEASTDIIANCPIKVGDIYVFENNNAWGVKRQYYKITKLEANVNGSVHVYGCKLKLDKTWGKRDNIYMFSASIYDNYNVNYYVSLLLIIEI